MLTDAMRSFYYQGLQLEPSVIREIEEMRVGSPARKLSQRGLKNTIVDFYSKKNEQRRDFESYTCEFLYGLELELFSGCHEYYVQVQPKNIERYGRTSSMTADFLVFEPGNIRLVECKPYAALDRLAAKRPDEWVCKDGTWVRPPVDAWARDRSLTYTIWSPPQPHGIYQANLLALYGVLNAGSDAASEEACVSRLRKALEERPITLAMALATFSGLTGTHVLASLIKGYVFGPLKSVPLDQADRFLLYVHRERSEECDALLLAKVQMGAKQPEVSDPVLLASPVDYAYGTERLERVRRIISGEEPPTVRYRPLVKQVLVAEKEGTSELAVCLTRYGNSGRRAGQLSSDQEQAAALYVTKYRSDPSIRTRTQAHDQLTNFCRDNGIRPPSRPTFNARVDSLCPTKRAYTEGGYRGFHAAEAATDPADRTQRCLIPGLMAHIDSTKFDERCTPDFLDSLGFDCPTVYIAMDSATGRPLGRSVLFGHASRNALAVLIRDVYFRQGFLPRYWMADGGSEYIGRWFELFCSTYGATRIQPPPGAPRRNSLAENALGRINAELAHRFLGSTAPDQKGRSVTHDKKSDATACHCYSTVVEHLDKYIFEDMPSVHHGVSRESASEKNQRLMEVFGNAGVATVRNIDDFLIATSVPLERDIEIDRSRGVRYLLRTYSSAELLYQMRISKPIEIRLDCVDSRRMYIKFAAKWVMATTADSLRMGGRDDLVKLFETLTDRRVRSENAQIRNEIRIERVRRTTEANAAAGATSHLAHMADKALEAAKPIEDKSSRWGDLAEPPLPFESEESE